MKPAELSDRLWNLAVIVGKVVDALPDTKLGRHVAAQLVQCGTAPAPAYDNSIAARSPDDAREKLLRTYDEVREARRWLRFIVKSDLLPHAKLAELMTELDTLCGLLDEAVHGPRLAIEVPSADPKGPAPATARRGLAHVSVVVKDTERALHLWRDRLGFSVLSSAESLDRTLRVTRIDLGNAVLQLEQPLAVGHPLLAWLAGNGGDALHGLALRVDQLDAHTALAAPEFASATTPPTAGPRTLRVDPAIALGLHLELTAASS